MAIDKRMLHEDTADHQGLLALEQWIMRLLHWPYTVHRFTNDNGGLPSSPETTPDTHPTCLRISHLTHIPYCTVLYSTSYTPCSIGSSPLELRKNKLFTSFLAKNGSSRRPVGIRIRILIIHDFFIKNPSEPHFPGSDWRRYPVHHAAIIQTPTPVVLIGCSLMHLSFYDLILQTRYPRFGHLPHGSTDLHPCRPTGACGRDRPWMLLFATNYFFYYFFFFCLVPNTVTVIYLFFILSPF